MSRFRRGKRVRASAADMRAAIVDVQEYMHGATHMAMVVPRAAPPPRLTHEMWISCCVNRRKCGTCAICMWEAEADRWHDWSPWRDDRLRLKPSTTRPIYVHIDAAVVAWFEWERHGRAIASAAGAVLELIKHGATFSGPRQAKRDNALLRRSDNIVHVDTALARAFAEAEGWGLTNYVCRALLIARTPGVLDLQPTFEAIAEAADVAPKTARAVVKSGRRSLQIELSARGLVPMPARTSGLHWDIDVRRRELTGDRS